MYDSSLFLNMLQTELHQIALYMQKKYIAISYKPSTGYRFGEKD